MKVLPPHIKDRLPKLEAQLQDAVKSGNIDRAKEVAQEIQVLFGNERSHHRLLRAKLWAFEAALDENLLSYAESGFIGIKSRANSNTRLYLEATCLLAVCALRQKNFAKAKGLIRTVMSKINNIKSDKTRHQFQKRMIERIEEECLLTDLIGRNDGPLDVKSIHSKAIELLQQKSEDEITILIESTISNKGVLLLREVREYSVFQIAKPDQKLLPAPEEVTKPKHIGKRALAILRRIAWRSICSPDSEVYKLWSKKIPEVFNSQYFTQAIIFTLNSWKIGVPLIASGIVAIVMKHSAHEFCEFARPKGLMISPKDKSF